MTIYEALAISEYITRPEINGFLKAKCGEYGDEFYRICIGETGIIYMDAFPLGYRDVVSTNWVPVKFQYSVEEIQP